MKFGGDTPNNPYNPIGPQGFPNSPSGQLGQGYSPGSLRNRLGAGLKASGIFQKDGQIQNLRGGFIGPKHPPQATQWQGSPPAPGGGVANQGQVRQLILQASQEGISANGVATISPDNIFLLIANLPPPQAFVMQGQQAVYAAYLVDDNGKTGFLVGMLRQVGNGVYRAHFQSPVPLHHYSRVVVSVENPTLLGQAPKGPIILKVKDPMTVMSFLGPIKTTATSYWGKIRGFFSGGSKAPVGPELAPMNPEYLQSLNQGSVPMEAGMPMEMVGSPIPPIPPVTSVPPDPPTPPTVPPMGVN